MTDTTNPFDDWARMWAQLGAGYVTPPVCPRDMMDKMTDSHLASVSSSSRYVSRWAELLGRAQTLAVRAMTLSSSEGDRAEELGTVMDQWRETYRELAELPLKESQQLQAELADIWRVDPDEDDESEDETPKRRQRRARIKS